MDLQELISGLDIRVAHAPAEGVRVCDMTEDSRTAVPGSLFIARRGQRADGRRFIADAVRAGASAVLTDEPTEGDGLVREHAALLVCEDIAKACARLAERFYGEPSQQLTLIGVTGTNGKTTTAWLIHGLLNGGRKRCGLIGTIAVDDGREFAPAGLTTPPAIELSRTLSVMVESGCQAAVMEVSSHALAQQRVAALAFDVGIFTNLSGDHLDYHGTMAAYAGAKAELFASLPETGTAIVNADDAQAEVMLRNCRAKRVLCRMGRGAGSSDAAWGEPVETGRWGMRVRLAGPWGEIDSRVGLMGGHNVMNLLEAVAAVHVSGLSTEAILAGMRDLAAPPGRLEPVTGPYDPFIVLVDYAHTDDALANALRAVRPMVDGGRLCVVFGCGGDRDATKRPRMGAVAVELADRVIVTSDNPRREEPSAIVSQILAGIDGSYRGKLSAEVDRQRAIRRAVLEAEAGDVVLIAGKGHETYQIVPDGRGGTTTRHFDDREVARDALAERGAHG